MLIRRTIIASAIAITTVLGTSACNLTSPVASMDYYAPSDGAQVDLGALKARNLMVLLAVDEDNKPHYGFVGSFANSSSTEITFAVRLTTKNGNFEPPLFTVGPYQVKSFGFENQPVIKADLLVESAIPADDIAKDPNVLGGSNVSVLVYTNDDQAEINVPVIAKTPNVVTYDDLFAKIAKN